MTRARHVTLGSDCTFGLALKAEGAKAETYPLDWVVSRPEFVTALFADGLRWTIDAQDLTTYDPQRPHVLADQARGVFYFHDFTGLEALPDELATVQDKYRRRSQRLHELLGSGDPVVLVRTFRGGDEERAGGSTAWMCELADLLEQRYPGSPISLQMLYGQPGPDPAHPRVTRTLVPGGKDEFRKAVRAYVRRHLL